MVCVASFSDQTLSPVIVLEATCHLLRSGGIVFIAEMWLASGELFSFLVAFLSSNPKIHATLSKIDCIIHFVFLSILILIFFYYYLFCF